MKYIKEMGLLVFLLTFIATVSVWTSAKANCTGCGEEGHEQCLPGDDHNHATIQEHGHMDGEWLDHKGADSMSDCLKTKRAVEKEWRNKAETTDTVELNGITYQIDGEHLAFMCDLVDAQVHFYEDGSWEIIEILGKHKSE